MKCSNFGRSIFDPGTGIVYKVAGRQGCSGGSKLLYGISTETGSAGITMEREVKNAAVSSVEEDIDYAAGAAAAAAMARIGMPPPLPSPPRSQTVPVQRLFSCCGKRRLLVVVGSYHTLTRTAPGLFSGSMILRQ